MTAVIVYVVSYGTEVNVYVPAGLSVPVSDNPLNVTVAPEMGSPVPLSTSETTTVPTSALLNNASAAVDVGAFTVTVVDPVTWLLADAVTVYVPYGRLSIVAMPVELVDVVASYTVFVVVFVAVTVAPEIARVLCLSVTVTVIVDVEVNVSVALYEPDLMSTPVSVAAPG